MLRRAAWSGLFVLLGLAIVAAQTTPYSPNSQSAPQSPAPAIPAAPASNQPAAQSPPVTSAAGTGDRITAGTEIHALLDTPLSNRTSRPGDRFTATISDSALGSAGIVVIPAGARVEGEVAEPDEGRATAALREKGALSLRFRNVVLPNGETLPLTATLISVHDTGKNVKSANAEGRSQSGARGGDVTRSTSIGAGGVPFGGPIKGLAIAPLAGGGYVLSTKAKDVILPAQTGMVIRLDQPMSSSGSETSQPR
jgi:hypothetical protein